MRARPSSISIPANQRNKRNQTNQINSAEQLLWDVLCADYEIESTDVNVIADKFVNNLIDAKQKHVPKRTISVKENHKGRVPWFNKDIQQCMSERDRLYAMAKITKDETIHGLVTN